MHKYVSLFSGSCRRPRRRIPTHVRAADGRQRRLLGRQRLGAAGDGRQERQRHADGGNGAGGRWVRRSDWVRRSYFVCMNMHARTRTRARAHTHTHSYLSINVCIYFAYIYMLYIYIYTYIYRKVLKVRCVTK